LKRGHLPQGSSQYTGSRGAARRIVLSLRVLVAASCPFAEIVDALLPRDLARALEFGGDVIGKRIDFIGLKRGAGALRHHVTDISSVHIVAALVGICEAIRKRQWRSWSSHT